MKIHIAGAATMAGIALLVAAAWVYASNKADGGSWLSKLSGKE